MWGHILARLCWGRLGRRRRNPQLRQCPVRQIPAVVVRQGGHILLGQDALIEVCCHKWGSQLWGDTPGVSRTCEGVPHSKEGLSLGGPE